MKNVLRVCGLLAVMLLGYATYVVASELSDARDNAYAKVLSSVSYGSGTMTAYNTCIETADTLLGGSSLTSQERTEVESIKADCIAYRNAFCHYWEDPVSTLPDNYNSYDSTDPWDWNFTYSQENLGRFSYANVQYQRAVHMEDDGAVIADTITAYNQSASALSAFINSAASHLTDLYAFQAALDAYN